MKRDLVIIRFGVPTPLKKEIDIVSHLSEQDLEGSVCGSMGDMGLISIIRTRFTEKEVVAAFKKVADETGDTLPTLVFELDSPKVAHFLEDMLEFGKLVDQFKEYYGTKKCTMSIDELLDRLNQVGIERLTPAELTRLKELTQ